MNLWFEGKVLDGFLTVQGRKLTQSVECVTNVRLENCIGAFQLKMNDNQRMSQ